MKYPYYIAVTPYGSLAFIGYPHFMGDSGRWLENASQGWPLKQGTKCETPEGASCGEVYLIKEDGRVLVRKLVETW